MKCTMSFLAAMLLAVAGFAQASWTLSPASGTNFYSDDAAYNGMISATYSDAIVTTDAKVEITVDAGTPVDITAASITNNGAFIDPAGQLTISNIGKPFTVKITGVKDANGIAVADLTGTYTYQGNIPVDLITPAKGDTLASKTQTVTIPFTKNITCTSIVITSGTKVTTLPGVAVATNSVTVSLTADHWGAPIAGYNHVTIALKDVKDPDGTEFSNTPGTSGTITTYYTVADATSTVNFQGVDPDPEWTLAGDLWTVGFIFSDAVVMTNTTATAVIKYYDIAGATEPIETINIPSAVVEYGWNPRQGTYWLTVPIDPYADIEFMHHMTIELQGITYKGNSVVFPVDKMPVTYLVAFEAPVLRAPATRGEHGGGTTGIQSEKADANKMVNIYSVQGILLKKNVPAATVNTLEKGLYIVDGKKTIVK